MYVAIALSGFCALAAQVIWTRVLSLLFGASTYTFSLILAVFLIGLGIGSSIGSIIAKSVERPTVALGWCQLLNVGAMAWSAYMLMESLPYWPINTSITTQYLVQLPARFRARLLGRAAGADSVGRELSARARVGGETGRRPGTPCRRRVRRQHGRRDLRFRHCQPDSRLLVRIAARSAGADDRVGHVRLAPARAGAAELTVGNGLGGTELYAAMGGERDAHHCAGRCRVPDSYRADDSRHSRRLRPVRGDVDGAAGRHLLRRRRPQLVGRRLALRRRDELPQRGKSAGLESAAGHAAAADARPLHDARAEIAEEGARHRLRRRRHRRAPSASIRTWSR